MGLVSSWSSTSAASNPSPCSTSRSFVSGCCAGITMNLANHGARTVRQNTRLRANQPPAPPPVVKQQRLGRAAGDVIVAALAAEDSHPAGGLPEGRARATSNGSLILG